VNRSETARSTGFNGTGVCPFLPEDDGKTILRNAVTFKVLRIPRLKKTDMIMSKREKAII
jgi:hypothetical protein